MAITDHRANDVQTEIDKLVAIDASPLGGGFAPSKLSDQPANHPIDQFFRLGQGEAVEHLLQDAIDQTEDPREGRLLQAGHQVLPEVVSETHLQAVFKQKEG